MKNPRYKDITGQRFGRTTAKRMVGRDKHRLAIWKCLCDCGTYHKVSGVKLRSGSTKSCGCLARELKEKRTVNLEGQTFGRWHVLAYAGQTQKGRQSLWECECTCGTCKTIRGDKLVRGESRSCGCLATELRRERFIKSNPNRKESDIYDGK